MPSVEPASTGGFFASFSSSSSADIVASSFANVLRAAGMNFATSMLFFARKSLSPIASLSFVMKSASFSAGNGVNLIPAALTNSGSSLNAFSAENDESGLKFAAPPKPPPPPPPPGPPAAGTRKLATPSRSWKPRFTSSSTLA